MTEKKRKRSKKTYMPFWERQARALLAKLNQPIPTIPTNKPPKSVAAMTKDELTARRLAAGLSMTQLAKLVGVSVVSISRYESGERAVGEVMAAKVRAALSRYLNA